MAIFALKWPSMLFELYIKSSLHVALAVLALSYVTVHEFGLTPDLLLLGFIFSSTVLSYNLTKYLSVVESDSIRMSPLLKWVGILTGFSLLVTCALLLYLPADIIIFAAILGVITIAYAIPISEGRKNLRNIYGIKIVVIAFVWAGVTVGLPVVNHGIESVNITHVLLETIQRLLFVVVLILPFDIRDYRSDEPALGTLPQLIGVKKTRVMGLILLSVCIVIEGLQQSAVTASFLIFLLVSVITALMVRHAMVVQTKYYASFWVEGIPILWVLMLTIFDLF